MPVPLMVGRGTVYLGSSPDVAAVSCVQSRPRIWQIVHATCVHLSTCWEATLARAVP